MSKLEPDELNNMAALWQQQSTGVPNTFAIAARRKHRRLLLQDRLWTFVMLIAGVLFLGLSRSALNVVAAIALFTGAALQLRQAYYNRARTLHYDDWSARGLIEFRLLVCETELQRFRYTQYGAAVIILFTLLLALMKHQFGILVPMELLVGYYVILPFMVVMLWYYQLRIRDRRKRLVHLQRLLKEFVLADDS